MRGTRSSLAVLTLAALLPAALSGCASYRAYSKCGYSGCPGDQQISAEVRSLLFEHVELRAPNLIYVHTLDGVVYLSGQVATDLQREIAESVAREAPDVRSVVDMISLMYRG